MRDMRMVLTFRNRKCLIAKKRPDGAVKTDSSSFFDFPPALP
jgi:hypothetical protein